jgi:hypothetical protein
MILNSKSLSKTFLRISKIELDTPTIAREVPMKINAAWLLGYEQIDMSGIYFSPMNRPRCHAANPSRVKRFPQSTGLNTRTNNGLVQTFKVNGLNGLTNTVRSGTFTVAGLTTGAATNVTVNTSNAVRYAGFNFTRQP